MEVENMNTMGQRDNQSPPHQRPKPPDTTQAPPPPQKCPRCNSSNTKFCYYNNYSLTQPRYFCKGCRRYWTHGGTLRNVPPGGGCRKTKRPKTSANASSSTSGEMVRPAQALPIPARPLILPGMDPSQGLRTGYYTGGTLLSSFGGMQTLPAGLNHQPAAGLNAGPGRYGANMGLLQFQGNNAGYFPTHQHQGLVPVTSWSQSYVRGGATVCNGGDGGGQVGTSFNSSQWSSDVSSQGFNPSQ